MILLDENIIDSQRLLLQSWKIHIRQIGYEIGRKGMKDPEIIPFLHKTGERTFFTRDGGFYRKDLCHSKYCIVHLAVGQSEAATFIQRVLKHSDFNTKAKRMGKIVSISHLHIRFWQLTKDSETFLK